MSSDFKDPLSSLLTRRRLFELSAGLTSALVLNQAACSERKTIQTRAAVYRAPHQPLSIETIELDPPGPTEVLVRIAAVGLCRTDYHVLRAERSVGMAPMVLGHEGAGIVSAVGDQVKGIAAGDHVALTWLPACGVCLWCNQGRHHFCVESPRISRGPQFDGTFRRRDSTGANVGSFCMVGAFSEWTVVDQTSVVVVDRDVPLELAAVAACGVPAGVGAARHAARVQPGESVLVVGVGGDGMNAVQGARLCGARVIIAVDRIPWKLDAARAFGATHVLQAGSEQDLVDGVRALTGGLGVDHAFVCVDPPATIRSAFRATTAGGKIVMTALTPESVDTLPIPPIELLRTQKTLIGSIYGSSSQRTSIPELLRLHREGSLKLRELITRSYRLEQINEGYADLEAGKNLRGIVVFDS